MDRITNAPAEQAKSILIALCSDDSVLQRRVTAYLDQIDILHAAYASASSKQQGTKRKAESAIKICVQCQEPFYEEDNSDGACRYHKGMGAFLPVAGRLTSNLEPYDAGDFWADHDEDCHGEIDTDETRMAFAEGFLCHCCNKLGVRSECTKGKHTANSAHRGRYGTEPGTVYHVGTDEDASGDSTNSGGESDIDE